VSRISAGVTGRPWRSMPSSVAGIVLPCWCASSDHAFSAMAAAGMLHLRVQHVAPRLGERATQRLGVLNDLRREIDEE
jgi:hypothetical protein